MDGRLCVLIPDITFSTRFPKPERFLLWRDSREPVQNILADVAPDSTLPESWPDRLAPHAGRFPRWVPGRVSRVAWAERPSVSPTLAPELRADAGALLGECPTCHATNTDRDFCFCHLAVLA